MNDSVQQQQSSDPGTRVTLCPDGVYRWTYTVNLYKNLSILSDLLKVVGLCFGFVFLLMIAVNLFSGDMDADAIKGILIAIVSTCAFMFVISLISYYIWAMMKGGEYCALMEMDENGVTHTQMDKHVTRTRMAGFIAGLLGVATDSPQLTANSILAASVNSWNTEFKKVRKVIPVRKRNLIKVNCRFTKNRVFVEPDDYGFVLDFISRRCINTK